MSRSVKLPDTGCRRLDTGLLPRLLFSSRIEYPASSMCGLELDQTSDRGLAHGTVLDIRQRRDFIEHVPRSLEVSRTEPRLPTDHRHAFLGVL